jgi:hypothetical protein
VRLFHFSEEPDIEVFEPRLMAARPEITAPLVWAIEEAHQAMYLFPRDCPRILFWPLPTTTPEDLERYWGRREGVSAVACIEWDWLERMHSTPVTRYHLPPDTFEDLQDAGMWVTRQAVRPSLSEPVGDLVEALRREGVELRLMRRLTPLRGLWETSLHASGIRLRNALDWEVGPGTVPPRLREVIGRPGSTPLSP